jgi:hypothetical protein
MADVLVLTRRDGTEQIAHIGSPYLAVMFERTFKRQADNATDNSWMAFYDAHDRAPESDDEMLDWLRQFVATEVRDLRPNPNGSAAQPDSSLT